MAYKFKVHYHLLYTRFNGQLAATSKGGYNKALTNDQDQALRQFINYLINIGH